MRFLEEKIVEEIIWSYGSPSGGRAHAGAKPVNIHDYILHYAKIIQIENKINFIYRILKNTLRTEFKYVDKDGRRYQRVCEGVMKRKCYLGKQYLDESKGLVLQQFGMI